MQPVARWCLLSAMVLLLGAAMSLALFHWVRPRSEAVGIAPGTKRMADRLAGIARTTRSVNGHNNQDTIDQLRGRLSLPLVPQQESFLRQVLARELLIAGRSEQALTEYRAARDRLAAVPTQSAQQAREKLRYDIAICCLRLGEQENCIASHTIDSCLIPIRAGTLGVHHSPRGSRMAIAEYSAILENEPQDLAARWLLNIAHMTLGEYPEQVPESWLIPPDVFASEVEFPRFYDIAPHLGLDVIGLSGGVVTEDFDGDGFLDIMVSSMGYTDQLRLFHNEGNGRFADWTDRAGLTGIVGGLNLCHADYDNDGFPDVLVLRGGWLRGESRLPKSLLHNRGNGTFEDVTEQAGLLTFGPTQTAGWADFDGDGWLDLFIGNESTPPLQNPCELFHNNHDGTFTECAARLGVAVQGMVKGVVWGDFNNDGRPDLYISRYGQPNLLFRNDGPAPSMPKPKRSELLKRTGNPWWVFTEVAEQAAVSDPVWSFPVWFWDYDNDGWEDLLVFGYRPKLFASGEGGLEATRETLANVVRDYLGQPHTGQLPCLYRNRRDGTFENVTKQAGLDKVLLAMGCNFGDLDNDGYLDFYVGTGDPDFSTLVPNRMFRNVNGERFQDVTTAGGFGHLQKGHGIAFADLDNDGDLDIYAVMGGFFVGDVFQNCLFENPGFGNHWVTLQLEGVRANRCALGARIRVDADTAQGPRSIYRTVGTGGSFGSSSLQQVIGLGQALGIRQVAVTWPVAGGHQEVYTDVPMDHVVKIREGRPTVTAVRPKVLSLSPTRGREPPPEHHHEPK